MNQARIKELSELIIRYKNSYYNGAKEIEDEEYDELEEELRRLAPEHWVLKQVGGQAGDLKHDVEMLSLDKKYSFEELENWQGSEELIGTLKVDGSSCSLIYKDGVLVQAKTRGDGKFGESLMEQALSIATIPKFLPGYSGEIRGEIFCYEANFFALTHEMEKLGLNKPKSQRNIVAGILGRKENKNLARFLNFMAFEILHGDFKSEEDKMKTLDKMGFTTAGWKKVKTKKEVQEFLEGVQKFIADGDFLADGAVFTYNSIKLQKEKGFTSHHPKFKMAFKFQGEIKTTKIESISWQLSRAGILTPVANLEAVDLKGVTITKVTLHNASHVEEFNLKAGDSIKIIRSGEVIPKFLEVDTSAPGKCKLPNKCPSCAHELIKEEVRLICPNRNSCPAQKIESFVQFAAKMGIEDLSEKRITSMLDLKIVDKLSDLYRLNVEDLLKLPLTKEKMAEKIYKNIQSSKKEKNLGEFFDALGFKGGAKNKVKLIQKEKGIGIEDFFKLKVEDLTSIKGFAEKSAQDFISSLADNKALIEELVGLGFTFEEVKVVSSDGPLKGQKICITGATSKPRKELEALLESFGAETKSGVSKDLTILVSNEQEASSKLEKARALGVSIMSEEELKKQFALSY